VGEQTGQTKNRSKLAPPLAIESKFEVSRLLFPFMLNRPTPDHPLEKPKHLVLKTKRSAKINKGKKERYASKATYQLTTF
jgi:hypothetical protein